MTPTPITTRITSSGPQANRLARAVEQACVSAGIICQRDGDVVSYSDQIGVPVSLDALIAGFPDHRILLTESRPNTRGRLDQISSREWAA